MGGILSYGVESEENTCCDNYKVDKCTQTCNEEYCTKCKELKSKEVSVLCMCSSIKNSS